jgi:hypothetical protein
MSATGQAANVSTATAAGGGIVTAGAKAVETFTVTGWINDNAIIIGIFCTVLSLIMSLIFNLINRKDSKAKQLEERRLRATVEWIREGKTDEEITILLKRTGLE